MANLVRRDGSGAFPMKDMGSITTTIGVERVFRKVTITRLSPGRKS